MAELHGILYCLTVTLMCTDAQLTIHVLDVLSSFWSLESQAPRHFSAPQMFAESKN